MIDWKSQTATRKAGWLALAAAVLTVGLITYGSWVRASGSGLGCPDWPLCEGALVPGLEGDTAIEFGHRFYAGLTMIVVAAAAWFAWVARAQDALLAKVLVGALAAILVQAALGGITVLTELHGMVRLAHLMLAMGTLALLTGGAVRGLDVQGSEQPGIRLASTFAVWAGIVVLMGGTIVGRSLSGACPGLPFCDDRSPLEAAWLHGLHRTLAVLLLAGLVWLAFRLRKHRGTKLATALNHSAILFIIVQVAIGVTAIVQSLPMSLRILHLGMASLIWWAFVAQWLLALKARGDR